MSDSIKGLFAILLFVAFIVAWAWVQVGSIDDCTRRGHNTAWCISAGKRDVGQ